MSEGKSGIGSQIQTALAVLFLIVVGLAVVTVVAQGGWVLYNTARDSSGCESRCLTFNGGRAELIDGECWCREGKIYRRPVVR